MMDRNSDLYLCRLANGQFSALEFARNFCSRSKSIIGRCHRYGFKFSGLPIRSHVISLYVMPLFDKDMI